MGSLESKCFVVTGCASGIGKATTVLLKSMGADVIGIDRHTTPDLDDFYRCDLSDPGALAGVVSSLPRGINGLANIAGLPPVVSAAQVMKVNFLAVRALTLGLADTMEKGASIVNLASLAGANWAKSVKLIKELYTIDHKDIEPFLERHSITNKDGRSYFFAKEAVIAWTLKNCNRWHVQGIRMNALSPGPVATPILPDLKETLGTDVEKHLMNAATPGHPDDIACAIAFMLSDESVWINGANIAIDGGLSAQMASAFFNL